MKLPRWGRVAVWLLATLSICSAQEADPFYQEASPACSERETILRVAAAHAWEVRYRPPPGWAGGSPVVLIDKVTCQVVSSMGQQ